jgi:hypothetical protein
MQQDRKQSHVLRAQSDTLNHVENEITKLEILTSGRVVHPKLNGCGTHMERILSVHDLFWLPVAIGKDRGRA